MGDRLRTKPSGVRFFLSAVICVSVLTTTTFAVWCPSADLNGNCQVNIYDLKILADQWLNTESCEETDTCADFDGLNSVNFTDFVFLANQWQTRGNMLFVNEFMASNNSDSGISDPQGDYDDWIEIYNLGDTAVDMGGMYLTDTIANPTKFHIPTGYSSQTTIPAGGFLVFWADEETTDGPLHTNFKLSADAETIGLADAAGTLTDSVTFGGQTTNISYGRYPSGEENWRFFPIPTPAADNNGGYIDDVEKVEFSKERGFYDASFNLILACTTSGANIYYTTDGRAPVAGEVNSPTSIRYISPIAISDTKSIRAAAVKTGWKPSPIETHTYIFGASAAVKAMPLMSLVGDPNQSLYEPNGIMAIVGGYYNGDGVWQSSGTGSYNNPMHRGIAYERPVSFEIIDQTADSNYQMDCGIRVHGSDYTRPRYTRGDDWLCNYSNTKFSFNLFFRDDYGNDRFEYPFFSFTPEVDQYQSVALRGGHNDLCSPFVKDEWTRRLFKEMGQAQATGRFANLYINGAYKYYYNPIAREDEEFFQEWYNSDYDFDVITQSGLRDGDTTAWNNLINYANSNDLSNAGNYIYFASKFDIATFIDYMILEIHSGNFDWPGNNWTVHREKSANGIFRFSIWDADGIAESWIFGDNCEYCYKTAFEDFPSWTSPTGLNHLQGDPSSQIYRALRANPDFRQFFADRIHKHYRNGGVLTQSHLIDKWWEVQNEVSSVLPYLITYVPNVFLPVREPYVLAAFETNNLFDRAFGAPVFYVNSSYKFGGYVSSTDSFAIADPCTSGGTIYYTTDGSDPRMPAGGQPKTFLTINASKKFLVPTSDIGTTWRGGSEPYNDASWINGTGGLGYEYGTGYEQYIDTNVGSVMYNVNTTCYIRIPFSVDACDINNINSLVLSIMFDDDFVAYLNGTRVASKYAPASVYWNSAAPLILEASAFENFNVTAYKSSLKTGTNILAIHGLNKTKTDNDFLIRLELVGILSTATISPTAIIYSGSSGSQTTTLRVAENASKKVLVPTSDIGTTWRGGSEPYNDSSWTSGTGGVGYERDTGYESYIGIDVETAMYNINGTCYIRIPFNIDAGDIGYITALTLRTRYDDGFIAYINGISVQQINPPATPAWNSLSSQGSAEATSDWNSYDISAYISYLHAGTNILAIHGLNNGTTSSDLLISSELESIQTLPPTGSFNLNKSTNLRSRIYKSSNQSWSPLNEAPYEVGNIRNYLRITEIMYHPLDNNNPNDPNTEYIELKNISGSTLNLNLVKFDKGIDFTFGPNTLTAGQHILIVRNKTAFEAKYGTGRYIAGQYTGSLNNGGERIRLLDAVGTTILDFDYKDGWRSIVDGDGYSLTIINPADSNVNHWGKKDYWRASAYINGSPGWDDSGIIPNPGAIVINEVLAHAHAEAPDWIELKNTTASAINIGGWYLSDSDSNVMKYKFAAGTTIPANGYLVVYENTNFGPNSVDPGRLIPFALSENGDMVCLASALDANNKLTGYREKEEFGASETGVSFGRYYKASTASYNFVPMSSNTTGAANSYPMVGPIVITEIMYHPDWPATGSYANDEYEYIELRNTSGATVTLYDSNENLPWKFTNAIDYTFPDDVTIAALARILVVKNPTAFSARYPSVPAGIIYGPYSGKLANEGEQLELSKPGDIDELGVRQYIRVERVDYSDGWHPGGEPGDVDLWPTGADGLGSSLRRTYDTTYGNDPNNWSALTPTPGT